MSSYGRSSSSFESLKIVAVAAAAAVSLNCVGLVLLCRLQTDD